jgi:hypothetical protein
MPGAELLPASSLLAFFGDHDAVTGCFPFRDHCVFHWQEIDQLVPAKARLDPVEVFPSCALVPWPILDLPHPDSVAVGQLNLTERQRRLYLDAWQEIRDHGIPQDCAHYASFSKLLGWPALVQSEVQMFESKAAARLLLQADCTVTVRNCRTGAPAARSIICCRSRTCTRRSSRAANWKASSRKPRRARSGKFGEGEANCVGQHRPAPPPTSR